MKNFKQLIIFGSGDSIGSLLSGIFWFFLASQIDPLRYGELQLFLSLAGMLSSIALVGNISTLTIYAAKKIPLQSTLNILSLIFSGILAVILIIIYPSYFIFDSGILLIAYVINSLVIGDIIGKKKFQEYSIITVIQKGLTLGLGFIFYYLFGYETIIFALIITYILHYKKLISIFREVKIDLKLLKTKKEFIFSNYISSSILVGTLGAGHIDKIIIVPLLGFSLLGNFTLGMQIISVLMIFSNICYKFILSYDASNYNIESLKKLVIIISVIIGLIGYFLAPMLVDMFFPKYIETKSAIGIMCLVVIPTTIGLMLQSKILGNEKSRIIIISQIFTFTALVISMIILAPILGILGLAMSLIVSSSVRIIILLYYTKKSK